MTCAELKAQEAELKGEIDTLLDQIAANQSTANSQYLACLAADSYGGTYPSPLQMGTSTLTAQSQMNINARISYLATKSPLPVALMNQYYTLSGATLQNIYNEQVTKDQKNAQLANVLQQEADQGC